MSHSIPAASVDREERDSVLALPVNRGYSGSDTQDVLAPRPIYAGNNLARSVQPQNSNKRASGAQPSRQETAQRGRTRTRTIAHVKCARSKRD